MKLKIKDEVGNLISEVLRKYKEAGQKRTASEIIEHAITSTFYKTVQIPAPVKNNDE